MDIGGNDVVIPSPLSPAVASEHLRAYFRAKFATEERDTGPLVETVGPDEPHDFFFYTSPQVFEAWNEDVPEDPELRAGMIYVLCHPGEITIVHERDDLDFDEIRRNLAANWCY